ncbi:MAG: DUF2796 domain-containing protein [Bdellovibrionaceae bacterium]|nr:DUF2796 domain-containing protein [Pseudobdellovibrionaceae bacterium]
MKPILFLILCFSIGSWAHKKPQRAYHAHSHGHAHLSIAFDNLKGQVEFKSPADSILGFEHEPKSDQDKKKVTDTTADFESKIANYVQFDASSLCVFAIKKIAMVPDEKQKSHADFVAQYDVTCSKPVLNTRLILDFSAYKKIKNIETVILIGELQLKPEIKSDKTTIELK